MHTINVQSLMASVGESQVIDITSVWYLPTTEPRLVRSINRNVMLLACSNNSCQIPNEFFIFQHASAHTVLEAVNFSEKLIASSAFFPHNFAECWAILKILLKQLDSKLVHLVSKVMVKCPTHLHHVATLRCDVSLIVIHVSGCFCFWH